MRPWMAAGIAVAAVTFFVAQVTDNRSIFVIAFAVYLVSLAPLGWRILVQSDAEWAPQPARPMVSAAPTSGG